MDVGPGKVLLSLKEYWAIPETVQTGRVQDMEFPGVSKNSIWNFQGLIKNDVEFPARLTKKK